MAQPAYATPSGLLRRRVGLGVARLGIQPPIINQRWRMLFIGLAAGSFDISATVRRFSGWGTILLKSIPLSVAPRTPFNLTIWSWQTFLRTLSKFHYAPSVQGGVVKELVCQLDVQVEVRTRVFGDHFLIERLSQNLSKKSLHSVSLPSSCSKPMTAKRWYFPRSASSSSWRTESAPERKG